MATNLFTGPLAELRLDDVEAFLGLGGPLEDRPREGVRVVFERDVPDNLGETVAALANTDGGIILFGISAKDGSPVERVGLMSEPSNDLKTRIASAIYSSVQPRPRFEIGVAAFEATYSVVLAVLRVEEGDFPPYMFTREAVNKIPVRVAARNPAADLRAIEAMFARRARSEAEAQRPFPGGELTISHHVDGKTQPSWTQLTLRARPRRRMHIRIDAALEKALLQILWSATKLRPGTVVTRRQDFFQTAFVAEPPIDHEHTWRIGRDGSVAFATQILSVDGREIFLQELVDSALRFCLGARAVLRSLDAPGHLDFELALNLGGVPVRSMPMDDQSQPGPAPTFRALPITSSQKNEIWSLPLDLLDLQDPVDIVVDALNERLRDLTDGNLELESFTRAVRELWESILANT